MWKKIIILILILIFYSIICILIYNKYSNNKITSITTISTNIIDKIAIPTPKEKTIGKIIINKINVNEELYSINSENNIVEKHVTILPQSIEPSIPNSTIFIAAHSGTGKIAYFKNLNKLEINDEIILIYKNKTYKYIVENIWEEKKTGTITIPKLNTNQLILTTCSPTKDQYQLIINCIIQK